MLYFYHHWLKLGRWYQSREWAEDIFQHTPLDSARFRSPHLSYLLHRNVVHDLKYCSGRNKVYDPCNFGWSWIFFFLFACSAAMLFVSKCSADNVYCNFVRTKMLYRQNLSIQHAVLGTLNRCFITRFEIVPHCRGLLLIEELWSHLRRTFFCIC